MPTKCETASLTAAPRDGGYHDHNVDQLSHSPFLSAASWELSGRPSAKPRSVGPPTPRRSCRPAGSWVRQVPGPILVAPEAEVCPTAGANTAPTALAFRPPAGKRCARRWGAARCGGRLRRRPADQSRDGIPRLRAGCGSGEGTDAGTAPDRSLERNGGEKAIELTAPRAPSYKESP